jgi:hypothetical protein
VAKSKKYWIYSPRTGSPVKPSQAEKEAVQEYFHPLIEQFKRKYILKNPDKRFNYLIDIYSKWHQNNFYLCERFRAEHPSRVVDEFESRLVRLKYSGKDQFDLSYFRHTGQWHLVVSSLTLRECKEMILANPLFQPTG